MPTILDKDKKWRLEPLLVPHSSKSQHSNKSMEPMMDMNCFNEKETLLFPVEAKTASMSFLLCHLDHQHQQTVRQEAHPVCGMSGRTSMMESVC